MQTSFNRQNYKNPNAGSLERLREGQVKTIYDRNRLENLSKREEYEENAAQNEIGSEQNNQPQNYQNAQYDNDISKQQVLRQIMRQKQLNLIKNFAKKKAFLQSAGKIAAKQVATKGGGHLLGSAAAGISVGGCATIIFYGLIIGIIVAVLVILYNAGHYLGLF